MDKKIAIERKLRRGLGMSKEKREIVARQNAQFADWYAPPCKACGKVRSGTIEELMKGCSCGR